jgi:hypothetical protein
MQELTVQASSKSPDSRKMYFVDLAKVPPEELEDTWIPGTPCFVDAQNTIHLGTSAFKEVRSYVRNVYGCRMDPYPEGEFPFKSLPVDDEGQEHS